MSDSDRMTRAGNYVLGVMSDDERERAERDLEIDPGFRDAVVEMAGRMHVFDHIPAPDKLPGDAWKAIEDRLSPCRRCAPRRLPKLGSTSGGRRSAGAVPTSGARRRRPPLRASLGLYRAAGGSPWRRG